MGWVQQMHVKQANTVDLIQDAIQIHGVACLIRRSFERLFLRRRNGNIGGCFHALWGFRFLPDMVLPRLGLLGFGIPLDVRSWPDGIFPGGWFPGRRILHDRLNPAEHLTASLADGLSQLNNDRDRVEVRNVPEVLGFKIFLWAQAAAGHEGIGDTGGGKLLERQADVQLVQFFQEAALSCGQNILPIVVPAFFGKLDGDAGQLLYNAVPAGNFKPRFQGRRDRRFMLAPVLPQVRVESAFLLAGVRDVEHKPDVWLAARIADQADSRSTPPDIPAHTLFPEVILGAGNGVRPLGENHGLFQKLILVYTACGHKELRPDSVVFCKPERGRVRFFHVDFQLAGHLAGILLSSIRAGNYWTCAASKHPLPLPKGRKKTRP